jgi:hypothetical protein
MTRTLAAIGMVMIGLVMVISNAQAQGGPAISVNPLVGNQFTRFVFTGSGFAPGAQFLENFTDASGQQYAASINGQAAVVVAGDNGSFQVTVNPATDLPGGAVGSWLVSFCSVGDTSCYSGDTIDISG